MLTASRSDSNEKWFILLAISTLWIASYFCILCNSALEHEMIVIFNLSNTEFALFTTISFGVAIISCIFTPYIINKIDIYKTMLFSCICELGGQMIFIFGIIFSNLYIMYIGRIFIGFGYGIQNVTIYSTINIWFEHSQWLPFAINSVNSTYEIGVLLSRYCMQPLFNYTNKLYIPYGIGVILSFISILSCVAMIFIENKFADSTITTIINLDNDFKQIKKFNIFIWLIIIIIIIGWSALETFGNLFTVPLMTTFNINEWYADIIMSAQAIYELSIGQLCAYFISKYGFLSYYLISSMFFMSISMLLFYFYEMNIGNITIYISSIICVWIVMFSYIIGVQHFFAAAFSCLFMVCPLELTSIVNSVSAIGFMAGSTLQSYCFGIIADIKKTYSSSILMCLLLLLFGLIISFILYSLDIIVDGPLYKSVQSNKNNKNNNNHRTVTQLHHDIDNDENKQFINHFNTEIFLFER